MEMEEIIECDESGQTSPGLSAQEFDFAQMRHVAEQGDVDAQFNLGWCYYMGEGVPQDKVEAAKWYRKAAERGNVLAQCNLGWCYA